MKKNVILLIFLGSFLLFSSQCHAVKWGPLTSWVSDINANVLSASVVRKSDRTEQSVQGYEVRDCLVIIANDTGHSGKMNIYLEDYHNQNGASIVSPKKDSIVIKYGGIENVSIQKDDSGVFGLPVMLTCTGNAHTVKTLRYRIVFHYPITGNTAQEKIAMLQDGLKNGFRMGPIFKGEMVKTYTGLLSTMPYSFSMK